MCLPSENAEDDPDPKRARAASLPRARAPREGAAFDPTRYLQEILERDVARPPADEIVELVAARARLISDLSSDQLRSLSPDFRQRGSAAARAVP
jgi:hypothetical protein